jgi:Xaa-Pro aminopeptidase
MGTKSPQTTQRLSAVRKKMSEAGVDVLLVRSTDRYLNEYVPLEESARVWISGFTGSMGEVIVGADHAWLAVDGRYWDQAELEADRRQFDVLKVPLGASIDETVAAQLAKMQGAGKKLRIGYEADRISPQTLDWLRRQLKDGAQWKPLHPSPVEAVRGPVRKNGVHSRIRAVDEKRVGRTVKDKLTELAGKLEELGVDALLVQKLDEIAYLSNLRGDELPYQATFKAIALATSERLLIGLDPSRVPHEVRMARDEILFVPEPELWTLIGRKTKRTRIGYDKSGNTELGRIAIEQRGATAVPVESPIGPMKAKKNKAELEAMTAAFARADAVVDRAVHWLCHEVAAAGRRVTEADFASKVDELFKESSATGLSFRIISAAGKNGHIIHYSDPSARRVVRRGELMLLDTGAYYEEGYATDLTRTFLVDGPNARGSDIQRRYYTLVLKAAIAGMTAVFPEGTRGAQLDAIVRAPLWAEGLNYNHGTGHGVGINVHEFPPRIGPSAQSVLEEGFVFSIEPGVYLPSFGGIRIENLCTLEKARPHAAPRGQPQSPAFLRVVPLTYSPFDRRLIEPRLLTPFEKAWLQQFAKVHASPARKKLRAQNGAETARSLRT